MDNNNNNIVHFLSFEEAFMPNDWILRQFGHVVSTRQTNSMLGNANLPNSKEDKTLSKSDCVRLLAK